MNQEEERGGCPRGSAGGGPAGGRPSAPGGGITLAWSGVAAALGADVQASRTPPLGAVDMNGPSFALIQGRVSQQLRGNVPTIHEFPLPRWAQSSSRDRPGFSQALGLQRFPGGRPSCPLC